MVVYSKNMCLGVLMVFSLLQMELCQKLDDDKDLRKNFGFLRSGLDTFVLDKIFPTAVSLVKLGMEDNMKTIQCQ